MTARRSLLYLAREVPVPISSTSRLRTYNWLVHLARHFEVTLVCAPETVPAPESVDALRPYCTDLHVIAPVDAGRDVLHRGIAELRYLLHGAPHESSRLRRRALRRQLQQLGATHDYAIVFAERWTWGPEAFRLAPLSIVDTGSLQAEQHVHVLRGARNPLHRILRHHLVRAFADSERDTLQRAGLVLTESASERHVLREIGCESTVFVPAGLDIRYFSPRRQVVDPSCVVFYGGLESPAQRDALQHLQRDIMPEVRKRVRRAHVNVLARTAPPELASNPDPTLQFTGSLEDPRTALWPAAAAALPLRFGSGSRSRLAQLLALGVPVVATPGAVSGLDLASGDGVLIAPAGTEFARTLADVLSDPSLREDLSRRGRATAERRLSIAATYERMTRELADQVAAL